MIAFIKRLWRDRRGNALVLTGAALPLLVGSIGLAVDTIQWTMWKRQLQRAADSAAFAGVYAIVEDNANMTAAQAVAADLAKHQTTGITLVSTYPRIAYPTSPNFTDAVQVTLAVTKPLSFSGMFMSSAPTIITSATAALVDEGTYCVVGLAPTGSAILIGGSADIDMGCGAISNSTDPIDSVGVNGNAHNFEADPVAAVGGMPSSINGAGELQPYNIPMRDPYADLPTTIPSGTNCTNFNSHRIDQGNNDVDGDGRVDIEPGCYSSFNPGNGTFELQAGTYYLDSINLSLAGQTRLVGSGVTIILTGSEPGSISMAGNSAMDLTAPTTGTYANMLLIQAPGADVGNDNTINGNNGTELDGAIYFPSGDLTFTGSSTAAIQCAMIVAYTVQFSGSGEVQNDLDDCEAATQVSHRRVRLVRMMRSLAGCERGNSFIEMALALPLLLAMLIGMVDLSRAVSTKLQVTQAAQRTTELVQRDSFDPDQIADLETDAETAAGAGSNATVTAWLECGSSTTQHDYTDSCGSGEAYARYVGVSITKPFIPYFSSPYFPGANSSGGYTLTATSRVRVQ